MAAAVVVLAVVAGSTAAAAGATTTPTSVCDGTSASCAQDFYKLLAGEPPYQDFFSGLVQGGDGAAIEDYVQAGYDAGLRPGWLDMLKAAMPDATATIDAEGAATAVEISVPGLAEAATVYLVLHFVWSNFLATAATAPTAALASQVWKPFGCSAMSCTNWDLKVETTPDVPDIRTLNYDYDPPDPSICNYATCFGESDGWGTLPTAVAALQVIYGTIHDGSTLGSLADESGGAGQCFAAAGGTQSCGRVIRSVSGSAMRDLVLGQALTSVTDSATDPGLPGATSWVACDSDVWGDCVGTWSNDDVAASSSLITSVRAAIQLADPGVITDAPSTVTVPDCSGKLTFIQCAQLLRNGGLVGEITASYLDDAATSDETDTVESTDPAAGTSAAPTTAVDVRLYKSPTGQEDALPAPIAAGDPPPTDDGSGGSTGTTFTCPSVDVGSIDFTPLTSIDYGTKFPFGVFTWASNGVSGWAGSQDPPTFSAPLLGGYGSVPVDMGIAAPFMPLIREAILIVATFGFIFFLATTFLGFVNWGVGEQGTLF